MRGWLLLVLLMAGCQGSPAAPPTPMRVDLACVPATAGAMSMDAQDCGGCGPCQVDVYDFGVVGNPDLGVTRVDEVQWLCCGGRCVDFYRDASNCGGCGRRCQAGETCDRGGCR